MLEVDHGDTFSFPLIYVQALTEAIFAVTDMDPNMSVQKIEINTRAEEVEI